MGFLSMFRKQNPEDIYKELANQIMLASLTMYKREFTQDNPSIGIIAGAETGYFLLHWMDRIAFSMFGAEKRNEIFDFDEIANKFFNSYIGVILRPDAPAKIKEEAFDNLRNTCNDRQYLYAQCDLMNEGFPSVKTVNFAYAFFIHRARGLTSRFDVDDILIGKKSLEEKDMKDFPDTEQIMQTYITANSLLSTLKLKDILKRLK